MIHLLIPGTVLLSLLVGGFVFYRLRRRVIHTRLLLSLVAFGSALLGIWLIIVGTLLAALFEPWPLSLRQGPDTDYARSCFERYLGEMPPPTIVEVYCREEWGFGGDSIYSVRFSFANHSQVERLTQLRNLHRVEKSNRSAFRYIRGPSWWPSETDLFALSEAYQRNEIEYLWVDPAARVAYYQEAGF